MLDTIISIFILMLLTPCFIIILYFFKDLFKKTIKNDVIIVENNEKHDNKPVFRGNKPIIRYKNEENDTKI
jgi:hypothetical protein